MGSFGPSSHRLVAACAHDERVVGPGTQCEFIKSCWNIWLSTGRKPRLDRRRSWTGLKRLAPILRRLIALIFNRSVSKWTKWNPAERCRGLRGSVCFFAMALANSHSSREAVQQMYKLCKSPSFHLTDQELVLTNPAQTLYSDLMVRSAT